MNNHDQPNLTAPRCTSCGQPAHLTRRVRRIHRGDRKLLFEGWIWECSSACPNPYTAVVPYRFADGPLMTWEEDRVREVWQERFGEPMPPSEQGKHPGSRRTVRVPVMLTVEEVAALDRVRGDLSRSEFLRRNIPAPKLTG